MRISLAGGGTDLPSYYQRYGGFFMSAAIDKYVYTMAQQAWNDEYVIKYSQLERCKTIAEIRHPIVRTALQLLEMGPNLELCSIADIPAGTGLGSSGAFTTALLKALHIYKKKSVISPHDLAEQACHIELDLLGEPIGKQDQFIAAYGGITCFDISSDGRVCARPATISARTLYTLEDNLAIFFTGLSRSASDLLAEQDTKTKASDKEMLDNLHYTKDLGFRIRHALESGDLRAFGEMMHEHWVRKKERAKGISNNRIDELYELGLKHGALGGKLIGAGGGGFLMFYAENKRELREAMNEAGVPELRFKFDFEGTKQLV